MNSIKYKSGKESTKKNKNNNLNKFEKNLIQAQKLYSPNSNKNLYNNEKSTKYKYNYSSKNYRNMNQLLNNYMNDYEKWRKQNKIPKEVTEAGFTYQEYEDKKINILKIFNSYLNLGGEDEFNDTNEIIDELPDYPDDMLLKNDITSDDYAKRVKINKDENAKKNNKEDNNQQNQHIYMEEPNEDEYTEKNNNNEKNDKNEDNDIVNIDKENENDKKISDNNDDDDNIKNEKK